MIQRCQQIPRKSEQTVILSLSSTNLKHRGTTQYQRNTSGSVQLWVYQMINIDLHSSLKQTLYTTLKAVRTVTELSVTKLFLPETNSN